MVIKVGTCALCGQEMICTENDSWHPWSVEQACPPEIDDRGVTVPQWGGHGRPGREHFRAGPSPANRPHPTCIDVTAIDQTPRSEWICGPECPKEA